MGIYFNLCKAVDNVIENNGKIIINIESCASNTNLCVGLSDYTIRDNCIKLYGKENNFELEIDLDHCHIEYDEIEDTFYFDCGNGNDIYLQPVL